MKDRVAHIFDTIRSLRLFPHGEEEGLPYAYPCDNYLSTILSNRLATRALNLFIERYYKQQVKNIKTIGQQVCQSSHPRLQAILDGCYKSLDVRKIPEVYVTGQLSGINALSVGTDDEPIILISRKATVALADGELRFMLGHELGHIQQKNMICHTLVGVLDRINNIDFIGTIVADMFEVRLKMWAKASEYTADRAGLICCGSMDDVYRLFGRIAPYERQSMAPGYTELFEGHPNVANRLKMIEAYYRSEIIR